MCVTNGLAAAPPATPWSVGVSTSTNPRDQKNSRICRCIALRRKNLLRDSSFTMRSRYLCL